LTRPDWIPFADRVESPNGGYWFDEARTQPIPFTPKALVPHSAHAPLMSDPPRRFYETEPGWWGTPGCTTLWIYGDGALTQMVKLSKAAWGNGWLNRYDGHLSPKLLVREWYSENRNPNYDTISCEFAGYGLQAPKTSVNTMPSIPPTDEQMETWFRVTDWILAEGWLPELTKFNVILHSEISATACPDGRFQSTDMIRTGPLPSELPSEILTDAEWKVHVDNYLDGLNTAQWDHKAGGSEEQHNIPRP
jgi:hypothetical protein